MIKLDGIPPCVSSRPSNRRALTNSVNPLSGFSSFGSRNYIDPSAVLPSPQTCARLPALRRTPTMNRTLAVAAIAVLASSAMAATGLPPLRQGCGKRQEIIQRLVGYTKESSTTLNIGIVKEKWANTEGRVDVTVMPDGSACAWRELPRPARTPAPEMRQSQ